jgi:hypothetical protein
MQNLSPKKTATILAPALRRKFSHFTLALLVAAGAILSPTNQAVATKSASKTVDKYDIQLANNGNTTLLLADDGAILRVPSLDLTYYCLAPKWEIFILNNSSRRARTFIYQDWRQKEGGKGSIKVKSKASIPSYFKGQKAKLLYLDIEPMESLKNQGEFFYQSTTKRANEYSRMEVLQLSDKKITKQALEFLRWKFQLQFLDGPILKSTNIYPDGKREVTVNTTTISQTTIPLTEWRLPKNVKLVENTSLVTNERANYKKAAEMFDTLMP